MTNMTSKQLNEALAKGGAKVKRSIPWCGCGIDGPPKRNKYGAVKCKSPLPELIGRTFDSILERDRAQNLVVMQREDRIGGLRFQPKIDLGPVTYRADFVYTEGGKLYYEDAKGKETERFRLVKNFWPVFVNDVPLRVSKRMPDGSIQVTETIQGGAA